MGSVDWEVVASAVAEIWKRKELVVLEAPTGSGKTTEFPLAILNRFQHTSTKGRAIVLEPRRIATLSAAKRVSQLTNSKLGEFAGYRIRGEKVVGPNTKVEFWTDGYFNQTLDDLGLHTDTQWILFDEFHERSLNSDLSLGLALLYQKIFFPHWRFCLLSATLPKQDWSALGITPEFINIRSSSFPVSTQFLGKSKSKLEERIPQILEKALPQSQGHTLIFLPGKREIISLLEALDKKFRESFLIFTLHGEKDLEEQAEVLAPSQKRKIILSTNIAESSLTVDGVDLVIDEGTERVQQVDFSTGFSKLERREISQSSAKQRAGRAGRTGPGFVLKLYSNDEETNWNLFRTPGIQREELVTASLLLMDLGLSWEELPLLDSPKKQNVEEAYKLLQLLGCIDSKRINPFGKTVRSFPIHPRLSVAAHRTLPYFDKQVIVKKLLEMELLLNSPNTNQGRFTSPNQKDISRLLGLFPDSETQKKLPTSMDLDTYLWFYAFPDRIGKRKPGDRSTYKLSNGSQAQGKKGDVITAEWILAYNVMGDRSNAILQNYFSLPDKIVDLLSPLSKKEEWIWKTPNKLVYQEVFTFGSLEIQTKELHSKIERAPQLVQDQIYQSLQLTLENEKLFQDLGFKNRILEKFDLQKPLFSTKDWEIHLRAFTTNLETPLSLSDTNVILQYKNFHWKEIQEVQNLLPDRLSVPSGRSLPLHYRETGVFLSVKLQEIFGWKTTPLLAQGKIPLTLELLSPSGKIVQSTQDLANFWQQTYFEVKKELKGRYPKHPWPDDPHLAKAKVQKSFS